jgi:energy-converting hydrogenase Eha subunit G
VGLAGTAVLVVLLVILTGLFGGLFATFSTAFYRTIRPVDGQPTEHESGVGG